MDSEEVDKQKRIEWSRLIKKISQDCPKCEGLGFMGVGLGKGIPCEICVPKAKTITYLKDSGMSVDDIRKNSLEDRTLLNHKILFLQGWSEKRLPIGYSILKEEAKNQRKVFFIDMASLIPQIKQGNRDLLQYDTIFIDSIDIYRSVDQFALPWFDGILFTFKNKPDKKLIVGGEGTSDGYAARFLEIFKTGYYTVFV